MTAVAPPKDFKTYEELVAILSGRGMVIEDEQRTKRKLAQVGYYRLSGFCYPSRQFDVDELGNKKDCPISRKPLRLNNYLEGTTFNNVFKLYRFDKRLRMLSMDALERIEVHIRSVVAHELGKGHLRKQGTGAYIPDPMAWQNAEYVLPKHVQSGKWSEWQNKHELVIRRSKEDCIEWHRRAQKEMPFWVVIEAWDFGTLSKYFGMLKRTYQDRVCKRLGLPDGVNSPKVLKSWLLALNLLRNRCAHHARIWNQTNNSPLQIPIQCEYFSRLTFLDNNCKMRFSGLIVVINYLLLRLGPSSNWIDEVVDTIINFPDVPGCTLDGLGLSSQSAQVLEVLKPNNLQLVANT